MQNVFKFRDTLIDSYSSFSRSFTRIAAADIAAEVDEAYGAGRYWPEPLIQINPNYQRASSVREIIAGLPVTEVIIDPEEVKASPEAWNCIGAEETRLIDYTPGRFSCQKLVSRKYVSREERHLPPVTAPLHTLQGRCIATPRLLAHTLAQRFELHLPYYRIERMYERQGGPLSRQTLCGWSGMCADACGLIIEAIKREVFADGYVQIDEPSTAR